MFGFLDDVLDVGKDLVDQGFETTKKAVSNPIGFVVDSALSPVRNTLDIIDGLTEGELRLKAAISLGTDVAGGMACSELIEWYQNG